MIIFCKKNKNFRLINSLQLRQKFDVSKNEKKDSNIKHSRKKIEDRFVCAARAQMSLAEVRAGELLTKIDYGT